MVRFHHSKPSSLIDYLLTHVSAGSFGTVPRVIHEKKRSYQDRAEARPDPYIRYEYPKLLDESRGAIAKLLNVPTETCVFVPNATTAINTILRNFEWNADGKDEIIYFETVYGGVGKTIDFIVDTHDGKVGERCIPLTYPCEDAEILSAFERTVAACRAEGKTPRIAIFDTVSSLPGVNFPYVAMTAKCKELGILSLVDGAQGVGLISIDLGALDPDFFSSNCHKWLHVPRGCAVLYVPLRHQGMMRSSLPTSHGYVPRKGQRFNPLPPSSNGVFVNNFEFVGTVDNSQYVCVRDAIKWRDEVLGGEERILSYCHTLAREGGSKVAEALGAGCKVMENAEGTLVRNCMVNVSLPLLLGREGENIESEEGVAVISDKVAIVATQWMLQTLMQEFDCYTVLFVYKGRWWTRMSAQVYLDLADFEWAGRTLKQVCARAAQTFGEART
jgi:hercynylcysteine S-oxide lyase